MNAATLIIVLLAHRGYCFGGQEQLISVQWSVRAALPVADIQWNLMFGQISVGHGRAQMPDGESPVAIRLSMPTVRVRTQLQWVYQVIERGNGTILSSGSEGLQVYPPIPWEDVAGIVKGRRIMVMDDPRGLPKLLADAGIEHITIGDCSQLQGARADMVLIGANRLKDSPFALQALAEQVESGCQALILAQDDLHALWGYPLTHRMDWANMTWGKNHMLFDGFNAEDLKDWATNSGTNPPILQLPKDEPALELGYWPRETSGGASVGIDAALVVKAIGKGRVVFCQLPLGDWESDPRRGMFLFNAMNYLTTRPQPTPAPGERSRIECVRPTSRPQLSIFGGNNP
jgi:hypothetical protein